MVEWQVLRSHTWVSLWLNFEAVSLLKTDAVSGSGWGDLTTLGWFTESDLPDAAPDAELPNLRTVSQTNRPLKVIPSVTLSKDNGGRQGARLLATGEVVLEHTCWRV